VYTKDKSTGAAEVDSKMNSALAAELGAAPNAAAAPPPSSAR
jgi:hypothetical protein